MRKVDSDIAFYGAEAERAHARLPSAGPLEVEALKELVRRTRAVVEALRAYDIAAGIEAGGRARRRAEAELAAREHRFWKKPRTAEERRPPSHRPINRQAARDLS